jgi:hypothetical protein
MIIFNRFIPFGTFLAINLFGLIFVRKGHKLTEVDLRHESIHTRQMRELLYVPFYVLYVLEWLVRLIQHRHFMRAYLSISFEREAYAHQYEPDYLQQRHHFAWLRYL